MHPRQVIASSAEPDKTKSALQQWTAELRGRFPSPCGLPDGDLAADNAWKQSTDFFATPLEGCSRS
jgi:hypothetical protein